MREGVVGLEGRLVVVVVVQVGVVVLLLMGVLLGGGVARLMACVILWCATLHSPRLHSSHFDAYHCLVLDSLP